MRSSVPIALFLRSPRPITQHLPLFDGHFYESDRFLHRRSGRVVPKGKKVEPAGQIAPFVTPVPFEEQLEEAMHSVDGFHWVLFVRKAFGFGDGVDLIRRTVGGDLPLAGRSVADDLCLGRYVLGINAQRLFRCGLARPA